MGKVLPVNAGIMSRIFLLSAGSFAASAGNEKLIFPP